MPELTTNFHLPYPGGSDDPCDFAEQWCDFTQAIDTVFGTFQEAIDRTMPLVPAAIMQQTIPLSVFNLNPIPFDTVLADTANMTDMDADPFTITIRRAGRYTVAGGLIKPSVGAPIVPTQTSVIALPNFRAQAVVNDLGSGGGIVYYLAAYFAVETYAVGEKVQLTFTVGSQNSWPITGSMLSVVWHSDSEVP